MRRLKTQFIVMGDLSKEKIILDRLAAENLLITKKRTLIINSLCQYDEITDMVSVYSEVRQRYGISYAAFYACVKMLIQKKIILKETRSTRKNVYTFNTAVFS